VFVRELQTEAHVGLHAWEKFPERPTRLKVNVEMFAEPAEDAAGEARLGIVNYEAVRDAVRAWRDRPHVELLETLVHELAALCLSLPRVRACRVSVSKPDIFNDAECAGVELTLAR
jgi:7,8-dihydroneopterin aldolase/epimerase/oxygenase